MAKPAKAEIRGSDSGDSNELAKKQRKLLVHSLVKDFYPYKFSAGRIIQKREVTQTEEQ